MLRVAATGSDGKLTLQLEHQLEDAHWNLLRTYKSGC